MAPWGFAPGPDLPPPHTLGLTAQYHPRLIFGQEKPLLVLYKYLTQV